MLSPASLCPGLVDDAVYMADTRRCQLRGCTGGMHASLVRLDWLLGEAGESRVSRS